jgi:hypothetical protein
MDPVNDIVTLDITPSPAAPVHYEPIVPSVLSAPTANEDNLLCFKCHKSNARLLRFECHCDLPVHVECAINLKRKGYTCPYCNFVKNTQQITPESRLLPRQGQETQARSLSSYVIMISVVFILASILSYIIYNYVNRN